ncbi:hypothetical protein SLS55_003081 [Diplodia seriata]|uniref:Chch domain protein n=1 Tax=Diplodia seriata TaxID=420778 RepID=A0ABR3CPR9_9PEZI
MQGQSQGPGLFGQMASTAAALGRKTAWSRGGNRLAASNEGTRTARNDHSIKKANQHSYSGVAVGSSIGHAIGGMFGGGSSAPAEAPQQQTAVADSYSQQQNQSSGACAQDIGNFRRCMDENQGSLTICGWYLDQLKACQQAASQY